MTKKEMKEILTNYKKFNNEIVNAMEKYFKNGAEHLTDEQYFTYIDVLTPMTELKYTIDGIIEILR